MKTELSSRLANLRRDMSKQRFARLLGIPQNTYLRYEDPNDKTLPKVDVLARIARITGVSADWLLGIDNDEIAIKNERAEIAERKLEALKQGLSALLKEY